MIALSFARIHHENLALFGVLPLVFDNQGDYRCVDAGHTLALSDTETLLAAGTGTVRNTTTDQRFDVRHDLSQRQVDMVRHGGAINAARRTAPETAE